jgi:hypothetical protein
VEDLKSDMTSIDKKLEEQIASKCSEDSQNLREQDRKIELRLNELDRGLQDRVKVAVEQTVRKDENMSNIDRAIAATREQCAKKSRPAFYIFKMLSTWLVTISGPNAVIGRVQMLEWQALFTERITR